MVSTDTINCRGKPYLVPCVLRTNKKSRHTLLSDSEKEKEKEKETERERERER